MLTSITYYVVVALACVTPAAPVAEPQFAFKNAYPLAHDGLTGRAELSVETPRLPSGTDAWVRIEFVNEGLAAHFFNPFFRGDVSPPAALVLYRDDKAYVANLICREDQRSRRVPSAADWVAVPTDGVAGRRLRLRITAPPGRYSLQVVYFAGFSKWTIGKEGVPMEEFAKFDGTFDRSELFRSNIVQIEVLPK